MIIQSLQYPTESCLSLSCFKINPSVSLQKKKNTNIVIFYCVLFVLKRISKETKFYILPTQANAEDVQLDTASHIAVWITFNKLDDL